MTKERPILFNTDMVRAILDDRKTVTRRVIKPQPVKKNGFWELYGDGWFFDSGAVPCVPGHSLSEKNPYGRPGDLLYVRETWQVTDFLHPSDENYGYVYKASENGRLWEETDDNWEWKPSIFMPKNAARIWLQVKDVRVERLQDISEEDAYKEGVRYDTHPEITARFAFATLWDSINENRDEGKYRWLANPWVWRVEFERFLK